MPLSRNFSLRRVYTSQHEAFLVVLSRFASEDHAIRSRRLCVRQAMIRFTSIFAIIHLAPAVHGTFIQRHPVLLSTGQVLIPSKTPSAQCSTPNNQNRRAEVAGVSCHALLGEPSDTSLMLQRHQGPFLPSPRVPSRLSITTGWNYN